MGLGKQLPTYHPQCFPVHIGLRFPGSWNQQMAPKSAKCPVLVDELVGTFSADAFDLLQKVANLYGSGVSAFEKVIQTAVWHLFSILLFHEVWRGLHILAP